jgi:hypothetical protein
MLERSGVLGTGDWTGSRLTGVEAIDFWGENWVLEGKSERERVRDGEKAVNWESEWVDEGGLREGGRPAYIYLPPF